MTLEEAEPQPVSDQILDWLEESVSYFPSFFNDPYSSNDINNYQWWETNQEINQELITSNASSINSTSNTTANTPNMTTDSNPTIPSLPVQPDSSKKRKASDDVNPSPPQSHNHRRNQSQRINEGEDLDEKVQLPAKRGSGKKSTTKSSGNNANNGNNKEGRWAEQLLNPCATAITAGNLTRVQHLLFVLNELASATGDPNHRLAYHGLRALSYHLSPSTGSSASVNGVTFSSSEARFFQKSLLKFNEISPWFAFPSNIANSCILQVLNEECNQSRKLHILDIGVSHGAQWPTLLDGLSRRSEGPPPLVRLTVVSASTDGDRETPFSNGPLGYDFSSLLLGFAKTLNINLEINRLDNCPLHNLNAQSINAYPDETLIVCSQFRLHHLNHNTPDERTGFLKILRSLEPKGMILSENNMDCSSNSCVDFATSFSRRVEHLWKFLDSTSSAFKGRESDERRMMEGEAAKGLINRTEMNEGKDKWCERMREAGFMAEVLGEDAIDGGRTLLRKHDNNWEMRAEDKDGCVSLWWKGQSVSFCSLWKLDMNCNRELNHL